jgi:hypothetical protein
VSSIGRLFPHGRFVRLGGWDQLLDEGAREPLLVLLRCPLPVDDEEPVHLGGHERVDEVGGIALLEPGA